MTLTEIVNQLRSCNYECEAGKLANNLAWVELVKMADKESGKLTARDSEIRLRLNKLVELIRTS